MSDEALRADARSRQAAGATLVQSFNPRVVRTNRMSRVGPLDILAFLIPASSFLEVDIIGRLFAPDILLAMMLPVLVFSKKNREISNRLARTFLLLAGLWLFGQVVTDLVRQTPFQDFSRGWSKIAFTMINFAALCMLLERQQRRIILFAAGLALGRIATYFLNPSTYALSLPWKFGYGVGLTWIALIVATNLYRRGNWSRLSGFLLIVGIGYLNMALGFRSLAGILFLTAAFLAAKSITWKGSRKRKRIPIRRAGLLIAILFMSGWAILALYGAMAESGLLGEAAARKYDTQSAGALSVLIGGRSEVLSSAIAVKDSPILGHGSWAKDCRYIDILQELRRVLGYTPGWESDVCLIPTHSIILGAWVEAGILGAIVWLWVAVITAKALLSAFSRKSGLVPLISFFGFLLLWDLAFSPYGASRRFETPFLVVTLMSSLIWVQNGGKHFYRPRPTPINQASINPSKTTSPS